MLPVHGFGAILANREIMPHRPNRATCGQKIKDGIIDDFGRWKCIPSFFVNCISRRRMEQKATDDGG